MQLHILSLNFTFILCLGRKEGKACAILNVISHSKISVNQSCAYLNKEWENYLHKAVLCWNWSVWRQCWCISEGIWRFCSYYNKFKFNIHYNQLAGPGQGFYTTLQATWQFCQCEWYMLMPYHSILCCCGHLWIIVLLYGSVNFK